MLLLSACSRYYSPVPVTRAWTVESAEKLVLECQRAHAPDRPAWIHTGDTIVTTGTVSLRDGISVEPDGFKNYYLVNWPVGNLTGWTCRLRKIPFSDVRGAYVERNWEACVAMFLQGLGLFRPNGGDTLCLKLDENSSVPLAYNERHVPGDGKYLKVFRGGMDSSGWGILCYFTPFWLLHLNPYDKDSLPWREAEAILYLRDHQNAQ